MRTQLISALGDAAVTRLKKERVAVTNLRKKHEPHAITAALSTESDRAFVTFNGVNSQLEGSPAPGRSRPGPAKAELTFTCASTRTTALAGPRSCPGCGSGA